MTSCTPLSQVILLLVLLLGPASQETINPAVVDLTNRNSDFSARVYRAIASRTDENFFLSPFTLSTGLLVLWSGTGGSTQEQLLRGLALTGLEHQMLPDLFRTLRNVVLRGDAANLQQGVAIFPGQSFQVSTDFQDLVQTQFGGKIQKLSYTSPAQSEEAINNWAQEQTGGKIRELVSSLDSQTQLLLASVASYQARFNPPFNSSVTLDERFFVDKYHVVMVPMMFRADKYFLAYDRSVKAGVLKLPMADGAAMLVVLPDEDVDITAVEDEVTAEKIHGWIRQLKKTKLEVQLPRFTLKSSYSLKDTLQTLDITQVFGDDADISNMGGAKGTKLSQVYHKSVISVDETTDDGLQSRDAVFSTPPPRLTINRPFIFIVYQQTTGTLLFMGRVTDPLKN
ncbi:Protein Z-dependent protease inhibitor [Oryzias melastigma]|uniref:Protein Z-dependent protease inhibitor n=1 Tax=Oryzias melastigma TaxID=30732 RepID=A0A3B3DZE1_ORYME|nr:serpin peptidase inhibitor, clade A (alpha-1 antiproteinase, antitrypsin), member 10a [Oryzias melastigma]KAF6735830.1 Protein Z-dependent protease inhibitor [Oryzias melastigma]